MKVIPALSVLILTLISCSNQSANTTAKQDTAAVNKVPEITAPDTNTAQTAVQPAAVKSDLPAFRMVNAANQVVDLAQYKGKKVFVNLWATWCPPCRAEIPSIESLAKKTDKNKVEFVMLSLDDNFEKAKNYAVRNNMSLPVYYPASTLPQVFVTDGIPMTLIFDEQGKIIFQLVGSENYDTQRFVDLLK